MPEEKFFTVVFKGDIKNLDFNPLKARTVYGEPVACCAYDVLEELDKAINDIEDELGSEPGAVGWIQ